MEESKKQTRWLWSIAGFKKEIIEVCKIDGHHAVMIASLLIMVAIYASIAWTLFFLSVVNSLWTAIPLGIFMGLFIFFLDRALISSLAKIKQSLAPKYIVSAGFRVLLALLIGYILAEPVVNAIYHREINREAQILVDQKNKERKEKLTAIYDVDITKLNQRKNYLSKDIEQQQINYTNASNSFTQEMDGTGGSGNLGYKRIAKKKEEILATEKANYANTLAVNQPKIDSIDLQLKVLEEKINTEYESFKNKTTDFGPLIKAEALASLKEKDTSNTLKYKHWLLLTILALIELSAFIVKFIYSTDSYSDKVAYVNTEEKNWHRINKEIAIEQQERNRRDALEKRNVTKNGK